MQAQLSAWIQAVRPLAQVNLAIPLLLGQAMAFAWRGSFSLTLLLWTFALSLSWHLLIVFANDYADRDADRLNTTYNEFSGGSRVIPEGKLPASALAWAALGNLVNLVGITIYCALAHDRILLVPLVGAGLLLLWAYSFGPRISYRGHGETLQGFGVGIVLPLIGYVMQTGDFAGFHWFALIPTFLLASASNILTSLPDYPADHEAGKRTYAVVRGQYLARRHFLELVVIAAAASPFVLDECLWQVAMAVAVPGLAVLSMCIQLLGTADARDHDECRAFVIRGGAATNVLLVSWAVALVILRLVS